MSSNGVITNKSGEILALTGLRFVAAFYVFLFHMHGRWPISTNSFIDNFLNQGYLGMSIFFMLSGFVLSYRYADESATTKDYLINRFARIYPIYALTAIITLPWIGLNFDYSSLVAAIQTIVQTVILVFSNIFLIQAWFPKFIFYWNDLGSWSISTEAFLYLLIPFVLPKFSKFSPKKLFTVAFLCYLLIVMIGVSAPLFNKVAGDLTKPINFFSFLVFYSMPIFRVPEFLIGVCVYFATRFTSTHLKGTKYQLLLFFILFFYLGFVGLHWPDIRNNWIGLPVIAFTIFSLSHNVGMINSLLSSKIFVWLGKISYGFYSFQVLVLIVLMEYHAKIITFVPLLANGKILALAAFVVIIMLSAVGYYFVEEPARRRIRRYHK